MKRPQFHNKGSSLFLAGHITRTEGTTNPGFEGHLEPGQLRCSGSLLMLITTISLTSSAFAQGSEFWIDTPELVAERRVGRTEFEYEFRAKLHNWSYPPYGCPASSVIAELWLEEWSDARATIVDGMLQFGPVAPGESTLSSDTFTVRIDRATSNNFPYIYWNITPSYPVVEQPMLSIQGPTDGDHTAATTVVVEGSVTPVANVTIEALCSGPKPSFAAAVATISGTNFSGTISLGPGPNLITVSAYPGPCGSRSSTTRTIYRDPPSQDDLSVSVSASSDMVSVGDDLTYTVTIHNLGPQESTDVLLTNLLPDDSDFHGGFTSQGALSEEQGVVTVHLGSLQGNQSATVIFSVQVRGDSLLNHTTVSRREPEDYLVNNAVDITTHVTSYYSFHVTSLQATGSETTSHFPLGNTGIDFLGNAPGDIAISLEKLLLTGPGRMEHYSLGTLDTAGSRSPRFGAVTDLRSGKVWQLGHQGFPPGWRSGGVVSQLLPLDGSGRQLSGKVLVEAGSPAMPEERITGFIRNNSDEWARGDFRLRTLLQPPVTGDYIFWFAGWNVELALSSDEDPGNLVQIVPQSSGINLDEPSASRPISLIAGRHYLIEVRGGSSGLAYDAFNLLWSKPGEDPGYARPIPTEVCLPVPAPALDEQGKILQLSHEITLGNANGIFSGYGRLVIFNGENVYNIDFSSGQVTDLGPMSMPPHLVQSEGWFWGVAENDGDVISLVYVKDSQTVVRTRVSDGQTSVVSTFSDLGQMGVIGAAPRWNKWAFASETKTQFDDLEDFPAGTADATFSIMTPRAVNDLAVSISARDLPDIAGRENAVIVTVTNAGPATATGVKLTEAMEGTISVRSVTPSQGTHRQTGNRIECGLGEIPGGSSASVTIQYEPLNAGRVIHFCDVTRNEPDSYLPNNHDQLTIPVVLPALRIEDVQVLEGDSGLTNTKFRVSLGTSVNVPVTVRYSFYGTGSAEEGFIEMNPRSDFLGSFGQLVFAPGETFQDVPVSIFGDTRHEADEWFYAYLYDPVGARIVHREARGTILNDDPAPTISVSGLSSDEGSEGFFHSLPLFEVTLSFPSEATVSVKYETSDGTAKSSVSTSFLDDYVRNEWWIDIPPGRTTRQIEVQVLGDTSVEPDETVVVTLSDPVNASLGNSQATGVIRNDDLAQATATTGSEGIRIEFPSITGARYRVEAAESVVGEWRSVGRFTGTGELIQWLPPAPPGHSCFYRVVLE